MTYDRCTVSGDLFCRFARAALSCARSSRDRDSAWSRPVPPGGAARRRRHRPPARRSAGWGRANSRAERADRGGRGGRDPAGPRHARRRARRRTRGSGASHRTCGTARACRGSPPAGRCRGTPSTRLTRSTPRRVQSRADRTAPVPTYEARRRACRRKRSERTRAITRTDDTGRSFAFGR